MQNTPSPSPTPNGAGASDDANAPRGRVVELIPREGGAKWELSLAREGSEATRFTILGSGSDSDSDSGALANAAPCAIGDIVRIDLKMGKGAAAPSVHVLTPTRAPGRIEWYRKIQNPRRRHALRIRAEVESGIRAFFSSEGFIETATPTLVPSPGMEIHVPVFRTTAGPYLPTSPEFAMKRLLVGGLERIFQLSRSYRAEPASSTHEPEFTMLEWYRAYAGFRDIMVDTERLVEALAIRVHGKPELDFGGRTLSVRAPWPRLTVAELFREHVEIELTGETPREILADAARARGHRVAETDSWDDLFFLLFLNEIEPRLPADRAVIVSHYPPSQAALAVVETNEAGERWARRFEFYIGGLELGNAFEELTDATEQRARFESDHAERARVYSDGVGTDRTSKGGAFAPNPIDEEFLDALAEGMPPSGGIAVGVDRLVMLLAGETDIAFTTWLPAARGR